MDRPILYFLVTNSLHQDQRLHRICYSLSKQYQVNLVGVNKSEKKYISTGFNCVSLNTIFRKGPLFYLEINLRFFLYLLFKNIDGVIANDLDTLTAAKLISSIRSIKLFVDLHEYFAEVPELQDKPFKKWIWNLIGRFGISNTSHNYTVNNSLKGIFIKKYKTEFQAIYNYPKLKKELNHKTDIEHFELVYVGAVNKGRGIIETIKAIKKLGDVRLTIIGEGDLDHEVKQLVKDLQLDDRVNMKGFIANASVHMMLNNYDIGLNILDKESLNYYYSSANKYFDYIMAGLPSISMSFPEYIIANKKHETSILIDSNKPERIKEAITAAKEEVNLLNRLKTNCLEARESYNWTSQKSKLIKIYNDAFTL